VLEVDRQYRISDILVGGSMVPVIEGQLRAV